MASDDLYAKQLAAESKKWGGHLSVEATREMNAWLDHPAILDHYNERGRIDGKHWKDWIVTRFGGPAERSLELGCGSGSQSLDLLARGAIRSVDGFDASEDRIREAEAARVGSGAPGGFRVGDANRLRLEEGAYDLIFSSHSFHHFLELESCMEQVRRALTPRGLFVLEEFVGPTQFQWTDAQIDVTRALLGLIPDRFRTFRWGALKTLEGRPTVAEVVAASPFESICSAEIVPLFEKSFPMVERRNLGGTIQHLLYNGIMHNFQPADPSSAAPISAVYGAEDALVDSALLPSDFQLLVGGRPAL